MDEEKLRNLEKDLKKEKERADKSEQEYFTLKVFYFCLINIFGYDRYITRLNLMIIHKVIFFIMLVYLIPIKTLPLNVNV